MIAVSSVDDNIALEPDITFTLLIITNPELAIGGTTFSGTTLFAGISVTIQDNDSK